MQSKSSQAQLCCLRDALLEAVAELPDCGPIASLRDVLLFAPQHPFVHEAELHATVEEHVGVFPALVEARLEAIVLEIACLVVPVVDVRVWLSASCATVGVGRTVCLLRSLLLAPITLQIPPELPASH